MTASSSRRRLLFAFSAVKHQQNLVSFIHSFSERPCRIGLCQPCSSIHVRNLSQIIRRVDSGARIESPAALPTAQHRKLGKSGLYVSVPILGAIGLGDKRWAEWVQEEAEALPLLKAAFDRGINTWDTSNVYSNGESERIIAKAVQSFKIPRHQLVICTKCGSATRENNELQTLASPATAEVDYLSYDGLSRQAIFNTVAASLARLQTDYIDLLQVDHFDHTVPVEETMKALHDLVESGTVRYIGACSMHAYEFAIMQFCAEKHGWTKFVSMQSHYSLTHRQDEREMIPFCYKIGVGLISWDYRVSAQLMWPRPKQIPHTVSKYFPAPTRADSRRMANIRKVAKNRGWPKSHVVLAWLYYKGIHCPIVSFNQIEKIHEALDMGDKRLTKEEVILLEKGHVNKPIRTLE